MITTKIAKSTKMLDEVKHLLCAFFNTDLPTFVFSVFSFENTHAWMIYGMKNPEYAK